MGMTATKVQVIIKYGSCLVGSLQRGSYLWAHALANGIVGTEEQNIIALEIGHRPILMCRGHILVELVCGITVFVKISQ